MAEPTEVSSILAIDIGSVNTQAVLIALVEGSYRFVARAQSPTTQEEPWADVAIGVRHAIEQLQRVSARPLLSDDGNVISPEQDDGSGVDLCVITSSAAQPLRLVLAGLVGELSLDSLRRAAAGTYSSVEDVISLLGTGRKSDEMRAKSILAVQPDAVCIAGGTDGGSTTPVLNLVESVALGASLIEPLARPTFVYAGNSALAGACERNRRQRYFAGCGGRQCPSRVGHRRPRPVAGRIGCAACQHETFRSERLEHLRGVEQHSGVVHGAQLWQRGALPQHDR